MNAEIVAARLRQFLLLLAGLLCLGTLGELSLLDHLGEPLQLVPFVLCSLALIAVVVVFFMPQRKTIWSLRVIMLLVALGGFLGIYEHLVGNQAFALEINQQASGSELLLETLTGASPALAPGVLIITAIVAEAATYFHPALKE
jgi:hypothetical protein